MTPRRDDRGGVRGRGDVRDPAVAEGPERRGRDDGRRLGRDHCRRDRAQRSFGCSPLPDDLRGRDRREAPAALEPQQPRRHRRRRDARHDPRGARDGGAPPDDRRGRLPRPRHPVERGAAHEDAARFTRITASSGSWRSTSGRTLGYAEAAAAVSDETGKPVLTATELGVTAPDNPGPAAVRASGQLLLPERRSCGPRPRAPVALRVAQGSPIDEDVPSCCGADPAPVARGRGRAGALAQVVGADQDPATAVSGLTTHLTTPVLVREACGGRARAARWRGTACRGACNRSRRRSPTPAACGSR